jgi:soluble lytic murein transglycosylase-like protein
MPQFTPWAITNPAPNVLFNPAAVDQAIAASQSQLGNLDINRQELKLRQDDAARQQAFGDNLLKSVPTDPATGASGAGGTYAPAAGGTADVPAEYLPYYQEASARTGIPAEVLIAQHRQESGFNPNATGAAGEIGIGQILPATARSPGFGMQGIDPATLRDPRTNINFSADYLKARGGPRTDFSNPANVAAALKNYNGGGDPNYVANVTRYIPGARTALGAAPQAAPAAPPPVLNPNAGPRVTNLPAASPATTTNPNAPVQIPPVVTGDANMAAVKQAATGLLAMPEAEAAIAYGPTVRSLQAQGFAMNAPATYPGHAALQALVSGDAATAPVAPSRVALRTGGTDVAGPGAGPDATLPAIPAPNQMYQTGIPGITINGPGNALAPPVQTAAAPPAQAPAARPPLEAPPAAPTRVIPREPTIQSGVFAGLTRTQATNIAQAAAGGAKPAQVMQDIATQRHQNDVERRQDAADVAAEQQANYARAHQYQQDQIAAATRADTQRHQSVEEARQAEELRIKQAADARAAANDAKLAQSKSDEADDLRVIQAIAPKLRRGEELTPEEADQYDIHRRRYAQGPLQIVQDGKGGTIQANVGREISDRFPPLPGQKEYAGLKPIPGTEKQPDLAPPTITGGMLANGAGQRKIMTALAGLEAHPDAVGAKGNAPEWLLQRADPEGIALRSAVSNVAGHEFHDLSGAAVSPSEASRLKFIPSEKDTAFALKTKLQQMLDSNRETMLQSYRTYGPENGFRRAPAVEDAIIDSIPQVSIDMLKDKPETARKFDKVYGKGAAKLVLQYGG